jgi:peptidoglycan hydrolase-like protein with peptidoglycan-binding domain
VTAAVPVRLAFTGDLVYGSSGPAVQALQVRLRQLRYFLYPEDTGYFGDATYGAVYTFQRDRHLPTTGVADQATVNALNACDQSCIY